VADKFTHQITDALTRLAAEPRGLPLYASKAEPGLFPNTAVAKPAAQKCLADELVRASAADAKRFALTEKGWDFLLAAVNPKQVLEDFVRALEARQGEVGELLDTARKMAESLQGLKEAVARVLPEIAASKVHVPVSAPQPITPAPPSLQGGGESDTGAPHSLAARAGSISPPPFREGGPGGGGGPAPPPSGGGGRGGGGSSTRPPSPSRPPSSPTCARAAPPPTARCRSCSARSRRTRR